MNTIPYTTYNNDKAPPLVFAHANGYPPACYEPLFAQLDDYKVLAMHQRPLWAGSDPAELKDWRPLSDDLLKFLDEQKLDKAVAIGHSVGGIAVLRAALQHPERFERIILLDPVLFMPAFIRGYRFVHALGLGAKVHPLVPAARRRRRTFANREVIFKSYRQKKIFRHLDDEALKAYIKGITCADGEGFKLCYSAEWEVQIYVSGVWRDMELWRALPALNVPLLIVRGEATDTFYEKTGDLVQKKLPSATVHTIPNSTHLVPLERPVEVANEIKKMMRDA
jgi:pimeloyl-ACP methyl ester carboxylesterase